ncbi:hypothetical protein [Massilia pseudoviolaceinigra]|uniref:hypothetical protein n=1 Tax=Massilia pseudoviolaceinigra TaxID=3057165 RepID=UPI0027969D25|nr:hypothetical protein [Massilia sp. CCM 9206]MDQ1918994.1 hypothetical protein [Massilia sp. CCM 9206]
MNNAHTQTKAVASAQRCGRAFVRRVAVCCLLACASLSMAQANSGDKERDAQRIADAQRAQQQQRQDTQRQFEARADEQRRQLQAQQDQNAQNNADAARRGGRMMTPDERRDLRRQINEAGVDIYRNAPRR